MTEDTRPPEDRHTHAIVETRGALVTVAQWDSWASEWLAKHPLRDPGPLPSSLDAAPIDQLDTETQHLRDQEAR